MACPAVLDDRTSFDAVIYYTEAFLPDADE